MRTLTRWALFFSILGFGIRPIRYPEVWIAGAALAALLALVVVAVTS